MGLTLEILLREDARQGRFLGVAGPEFNAEVSA
jgi:hypothetical protein